MIFRNSILYSDHLGVQNWRKCMGSRGQKKKRLIGSNQDTIVCQRRGLLESHAMSESHKQAYNKYLAFIDQMGSRNDERKQDGKIKYMY